VTRAEQPTVPDTPVPRQRVWRGVDISHWQDPSSIDWDALGEVCDFVCVRFTFGTRRDSRVERHVELVRRHALALDAYHFCRPHQDPRAQFDAFRAVDDAVGYEPGDLAPWLDIEHDPGAPDELRDVTPAWSAPALELCRMMVGHYGECLPYLNQSDFLALGSPDWVVQRPIAVAHWTSRPQPTTPQGASWAMWQHAVRPLEGVSSRPIDQDIARRLIHVPHQGLLGLTRGEIRQVLGDVALTAQQSLDDFFRSNRP